MGKWQCWIAGFFKAQIYAPDTPKERMMHVKKYL